MNHKIDNYIKEKLQKLGWEDKNLVEKTGLSKGQISKLKNGHVERLTAEVFYKIYKAFDDSCPKATKVIYPGLNLTLDKYIPKARNEFGKFMSQFETVKNSPEEIATKTRLDENRLKDLYFRKAALEAYEFLLIEKAIGKKQGELFDEFFRNKS
jgi:transcriptional regulator with XRE-family HTH domain